MEYLVCDDIFMLWKGYHLLKHCNLSFKMQSFMKLIDHDWWKNVMFDCHIIHFISKWSKCPFYLNNYLCIKIRNNLISIFPFWYCDWNHLRKLIFWLFSVDTIKWLSVSIRCNAFNYFCALIKLWNFYWILESSS